MSVLRLCIISIMLCNVGGVGLAKLKPVTVNPDFLSWVGCIDYHQAKEFLSLKDKAIHEDKEVLSSIDLSFSVQSIVLNSQGLCLPGNNVEGGLLASWDEIDFIAKKEQGCFALYNDGSKPWHVSALSQTTGIPASLCPPLEESGAPTMILGGEINPHIILCEVSRSCLTLLRIHHAQNIRG